MSNCGICQNCQMKNKLNFGITALAETLKLKDKNFLKLQIKQNIKHLKCQSK